ncbi:electron transfer flavoprotein subunit alpha/FixB family protein [bacterium]|nr:electron transfer flavoprotein subunit alpha/FixB family protein [bacterium]
MANEILILAEQWRGEISDITYELLALGREVATELGVPLQAVLLGQNTKESVGLLGAADAVLCVDHPALAQPNPETCAVALAQLVKERQPRAVLIPLTNLNWEVGVLLAEQLKVPYTNFCQNLRVAGDALEAHCTLYGGKMDATVLTGAAPNIIGILPGARPAEQGRSEKTPRAESVAVTLPETSRIRFSRYLEPEAGDVDITQQPVLVGVGRGIQTQDNLSLAEDLAAVFGGAVCASRPVIDQGWMSLSRQVGKSGVNVKPKLYVAAGISGAPEHVEGMKNSALIIALNTDPQAPIFNVAHYGVVADVLDVLPALTEAVKARKG